MTRNTAMIGNDTPRMTITPRQFAVALGVLMAIAGLIALSIPVSAMSDSGLFGASEVDCGSALADNTGRLGGDPLTQCQDALGSRRGWGWPLAIAGVVIGLAGAFVAPARPQSETTPAEND